VEKPSDGERKGKRGTYSSQRGVHPRNDLRLVPVKNQEHVTEGTYRYMHREPFLRTGTGGHLTRAAEKTGRKLVRHDAGGGLGRSGGTRMGKQATGQHRESGKRLTIKSGH